MPDRTRADDQVGSIGVNVCSAETIRALSSARRRLIVRTLMGRSGPLSVDDLASALVRGNEPESPPTEHDAIVALHHVDLPVLRAARLVTVDEEGDVVELGSSPDLRRGPLTALLLRSTGQEMWAALDVLQRDPIRSAIVEVVDSHGSLQFDELRRELVSTSLRTATTTPPDPSAFELALRHVHLPELDAVGLIEYDHVADTVSGTLERLT
jgi:DNA-binding transcriptional ArsR family regulator